MITLTVHLFVYWRSFSSYNPAKSGSIVVNMVEQGRAVDRAVNAAKTALKDGKVV